MDYLKTPAERQAAIVAVFAERRGMDTAIVVERDPALDRGTASRVMARLELEREAAARAAELRAREGPQESAIERSLRRSQQASTRTSEVQPAERQPDGFEARPQSLQERMAEFHARGQRQEPQTLQERSERGERAEEAAPVRKSITERLAELEARAAARPKTDQEREREIERDRERGGYER